MVIHGLEKVALTKRQEEEMEVEEVKTVRISSGVTKRDSIRKKFISEIAQVEQLGDKVGKERLRLFEHLQRIYWTKGVEYGATMQEENMKTTENTCTGVV